jgi:hypothetical protein
MTTNVLWSRKRQTQLLSASIIMCELGAAEKQTILNH